MSEYDIANRLIKWEERVTETLKSIDTDHAYIHAGNAFQANVHSSATAGIKRYAFITPSEEYIHFRPTQVAIPSGSCVLSLFETTVLSSGAAVIPAHNRSRLSAKTAQSILYSGATSTS